MAENLDSWVIYQKAMRQTIDRADQKELKRIIEHNAIVSARAGLSAEAILSLLIDKKIISKKEVMAIVDQQLRKAIKKK